MHDVAVVGGGPAGSRTAALLARNHDVVVVEEHRRSGTPMQCAGLVTDDVIKLSGVKPDILSTILGADVVFPDGTVVSVNSKVPIARATATAERDLTAFLPVLNFCITPSLLGYILFATFIVCGFTTACYHQNFAFATQLVQRAQFGRRTACTRHKMHNLRHER